MRTWFAAGAGPLSVLPHTVLKQHAVSQSRRDGNMLKAREIQKFSGKVPGIPVFICAFSVRK